MTEPRIVAVLRHEEEFRAACRARIAELDINCDVVDEIAGFTINYTSKLLAVPRAARKFSAISREALVATIGLREIRDDNGWVLVEDLQALERSKRSRYWRPRERMSEMLSGGEHEPFVHYTNRRFMRRIGNKGNRARNAKMPPETRSAIASAAAKARWDMVRKRKELALRLRARAAEKAVRCSET